MAKQTIGIGTTPNDGTGDPLRTAFDKTNDNFTELYNSQSGWEYSQDGETTPATIVIGTTPVQLTIDGLGSETGEAYLPLPIRGTGSLWDTANNKITPINEGDTFMVRLDLDFPSKTGVPNEIKIVVDIGATPDGTGGAGSVIIFNDYISTAKTTPFKKANTISLFARNTFVTNGGTIWLSTDAGTITLGLRGIFIERTSSGAI